MIRENCLRLARTVVVLVPTILASSPAHADFFDDLRRTFKTDIPHFFQDDIPCAFGGQPTSGTKKSCKSPGHPAKSTANKAHHEGTAADRAKTFGDATAPRHENGAGDAPPNSDH